MSLRSLFRFLTDHWVLDRLDRVAVGMGWAVWEGCGVTEHQTSVTRTSQLVRSCLHIFGGKWQNYRMCGRIYTPASAEIERAWKIDRGNSNPFAEKYNVAPQQGNPNNFVPVVRQTDDGGFELVRMQWWLLPFWSKEPKVKYSTFNARVETVVKAASFREPLKKRRCLIPVMGWYEWQELPGGNLPWFLHGSDNKILAVAGLWDRWQGKEEHGGEIIESCTIVVGPANEKFNPIHDRMPFCLDEKRAHTWLDRGLTEADKVMEILQPNPDDSITFHRVGKRVSNARNQGADLIDPVVDATT